MINNKSYIFDFMTRRVSDLAGRFSRIAISFHTNAKMIKSPAVVPSLPSTRSTVVFTIDDRVGALDEVLQVFKNENLNLARIESRPSKTSDWDYDFFVDLQTTDSEKIASLVEKLGEKAKNVKVAGSQLFNGTYVRCVCAVFQRNYKKHIIRQRAVVPAQEGGSGHLCRKSAGLWHGPGRGPSRFQGSRISSPSRGNYGHRPHASPVSAEDD